MKSEIVTTSINDLIEIHSQPFTDTRGFFLNAFREQESTFQKSWGGRSISQVNISHTKDVGVVRGLHYQKEPHSEAKLVRCLKGRVWDVAVDLRHQSPTYGQWHAIELSYELGNALLIPEGFAHGFQVLQPCSELLYLHSSHWVKESETGIRFNNPSLAINWPLPAEGISDRDLSLPFLAI